MSTPSVTETPAPRILVCGHSHCGALHLGRNVLLRRNRKIDYDFIGLAPGGHLPQAQDYWARIVERAPGAHVVLVWNGNEHNARFMLEPKPPIRIAVDDGSDPDPGDTGVYVPAEAVRELFRDTMEDMSARIGSILRAGPASLICTDPPPPMPDGEALRSRILQEQHFVDAAARRGVDAATIPITAFGVRHALRGIIGDLRRETCAALGVTLVPAPAAAQDQAGALLPEYWTEDATHANAAYGELLWKSVLALADPGMTGTQTP